MMLATLPEVSIGHEIPLGPPQPCLLGLRCLYPDYENELDPIELPGAFCIDARVAFPVAELEEDDEDDDFDDDDSDIEEDDDEDYDWDDEDDEGGDIDFDDDDDDDADSWLEDDEDEDDD